MNLTGSFARYYWKVHKQSCSGCGACTKVCPADAVRIDDNIVINHMLLLKNTGLSEHYSNSHVYMIITSGHMTIKLDDNEANVYSEGSILNVPFDTKMNVNNYSDEMLEFFVVKAPNPKYMID